MVSRFVLRLSGLARSDSSCSSEFDAAVQAHRSETDLDAQLGLWKKLNRKEKEHVHVVSTRSCKDQRMWRLKVVDARLWASYDLYTCVELFVKQ